MSRYHQAHSVHLISESFSGMPRVCHLSTWSCNYKIMILFLVSSWYFPFPVTNWQWECMLIMSRHRWVSLTFSTSNLSLCSNVFLQCILKFWAIITIFGKQVRAWAWARPRALASPQFGHGSGFQNPKPTKARPKPGLRAWARPDTSLIATAHQHRHSGEIFEAFRFLKAGTKMAISVHLSRPKLIFLLMSKNWLILRSTVICQL